MDECAMVGFVATSTILSERCVLYLDKRKSAGRQGLHDDTPPTNAEKDKPTKTLS